MRNREEAVQASLDTQSNIPNTCQMVTRNWFGVSSVGDFDGDGSADAEDGWKSEPAQYKHRGDRNPPAGVPVSYVGGSHDNGHRAISLGNGKIRSTDAGGVGRVATVDLDWPEKNWGLKYVGWSETCDGVLIPLPPKPKPAPLDSRGGRIEHALDDLQASKAKGKKRRQLIDAAIQAIKNIPFVTYKKK